MSRRPSLPRLLPIALATLSIPVCAQTAASAAAPAQPASAPAPDKAKGGQLDSVQVRGKALNDDDQRRLSTAAKLVFGREELQKYGDNSVQDVLKRLPGVQVQGGGVRMRGLGGSYTQILLNGEPAPPGFSLDTLNPALVERIEVTRGPSAENSAQAVAGTINIILKDAPKTRQVEVRAGLTTRGGYTRPNLGFTLSDRSGILSYSLPVSAYRNRGDELTLVDRDALRSDGSPLIQHQRSIDYGNGQGFNTAPRFVWRFDERNSLNLQLFAHQHNWDSTGSNLMDAPRGAVCVQGSASFNPKDPSCSVNETYASEGRWQATRATLQWTRRFDNDWKLDARLGGGQSSRVFHSPVLGRNAAGDEVLNQLADAHWAEQSGSTAGKLSIPYQTDHNLAFGWDADRRQRHELSRSWINGTAVDGADGQPYRSQVTRVALYAQDEWEVTPQWSVYGGLRTEQVSSRSQPDGGLGQASFRVTTPLLHMAYKLDPKSRDVIRASLTRSYRAPELGQLLAVPRYDVLRAPLNGPNTPDVADSSGNPGLKPELATGLDLAFEKYLPSGGLVSVSAFHRRIEGLFRQQVTLESVPWSPVKRWVSRPVNYAAATTTGLELEVKGRAGDLLPALFDPSLGLELRTSVSWYRSSVEGVQGPNNRLAGQQPYSLTLGFDHRPKGLPLSWGGSVYYTPGFPFQQTDSIRSRANLQRNLDFYALWTLQPGHQLRLSVNNATPVDRDTLSQTWNGSRWLDTRTQNRSLRSVQLRYEAKW